MYLYVKRVMDLILAAIAMIVFSPVLVLLTVGIKIDSRGPVFFRQQRVGKDKKTFLILKFRTMRIDTPKDTPTHLLKDPAQYITHIGKFLRRTSLDELPQLVNILKGDMSICGPRPALWNQADLIAERDKVVGRYDLTANQLRPGLTGWAQVNGRDELSIEDKARFDGQYVSELGFWMDCSCIVLTIVSVLKKDGVVEGGPQGTNLPNTVPSKNEGTNK